MLRLHHPVQHSAAARTANSTLGNRHTRDAVVVYADHAPIAGIARPGSHQIYRNPRLGIESRPLQRLEHQSIRVEMLYAGVCGTDLHLVKAHPETGYIQTSSPVSLPPHGRILGHEGIGRITEVGSSVNHLAPGAIVAFESIVVCGECDCCRRGLPNQCANARLLGLQQDGLYTTLADVPASVAHDVTALIRDEHDLRSLANLEPASVSLLACQRARIAARDRVVIFGAGPIGIYCAMLARIAFGARSVHVVEPISFRRTLATGCAESVHAPDEFFLDFDQPVDVVIEASGDLTNVDKVMPMIDADGRVVLLARSGEPVVMTSTDHIITNAISIMGSRGHLGGAFETVLKLYEQRRFDPAYAVTGIINGLQNLQRLLGEPENLMNEHCKVLVSFGSSAEPAECAAAD
jgi:threonine dehydrogenase-like Zn-dependent dehydrogenase